METRSPRVEAPITREQQLDVLEKRLEQARQRQAIAEDHRLARSGDSAKQKEIDALTREAYTTAMIDHGQASLRDQLQAAATPEDRNLIVLTYMMNEQKTLDSYIEDPSRNELAKTKREKLRRFGRKAMNATGAWLSKGNKWQQLAKGVVVGAGASLIAGAAGGAVAAGGIGAAAAAGGAAAVRYGKSYAKGRARKITKESSAPEYHAKAMNEQNYDSVHDAFVRAQELMREERNKLIGQHQERNRQAHKSAARAVAIGAVVGGTIGSLIHFDIDSAHAEETPTPDAHDLMVSPQEADGVDTSTPLMPEQDEIGISPSIIEELDTETPLMPERDTFDISPGTVDDIETETPVMPDSDGLDFAPGTIVELDTETPLIPGEGILDISPQTVDEIDTETPVMPDRDTLDISPGTVDVIETETPVMPDNDELGITPGTVSDIETETPAIPDPTEPEVEAVFPEMEIPDYIVSSGEGWYEAFGNLGIDDCHQAELLKEIGPELEAMGVAYPMDNGLYGINSAGELPYEATELIMTTAQDHGWFDDAHEAFNSPEAFDAEETESGAATTESEPELPVVDSGEGLNSFVADNYDAELTHEQSMDLGETLVETGHMYESEYLSEEFGNPYGISEAGEVDTAFNAIVQDMVGEASPADEAGLATEYTISGDDWSQIEDMLKESAAENSLGELSAQGATVMQELGPILKDIVYPDGSSVVSADHAGNWTFSDSESPLPQKAFDSIYRYLNAHDTAFDKVQELIEVV